jgi:hypothetical protein
MRECISPIALFSNVQYMTNYAAPPKNLLSMFTDEPFCPGAFTSEEKIKERMVVSMPFRMTSSAKNFKYPL